MINIHLSLHAGVNMPIWIQYSHHGVTACVYIQLFMELKLQYSCISYCEV